MPFSEGQGAPEKGESLPRSAALTPSATMEESEQEASSAIDLRSAFDAAGIQDLLDGLDRELVGLRPVKARIREIAALLVVNRARQQVDRKSVV